MFGRTCTPMTPSTTTAAVQMTPNRYDFVCLIARSTSTFCSIVFSKAFDMVDLVILARKLFHLQIPVFIIRWIMFFRTNRTQTTKLGFQVSIIIIVQCSGTGPKILLFMMFIGDLKPQDVLNSYLLKYADDVSLLCPQNSRTPIELEMAHVLDWVRENKMTVNLLKTVELVFRRPADISDDLIPSAMSDVRRVTAAKLLGVHLKQNLNFSQHVDAVVTTCNQRLFISTTKTTKSRYTCTWLCF